jgi:hypothetical protein
MHCALALREGQKSASIRLGSEVIWKLLAKLAYSFPDFIRGRIMSRSQHRGLSLFSNACFSYVFFWVILFVHQSAAHFVGANIDEAGTNFLVWTTTIAFFLGRVTHDQMHDFYSKS